MLTFFRRIRKGLLGDGATSKYLLYAIGEIALVVIGILIALQINNWNEERKRGLLKEDYIFKLSNNLESDVSNHKYWLSITEMYERESLYLLGFLEERIDEVDTVRLKRSLLISQMGTPFPLNASVYNELVSTGNFGLFKDLEFKNMIETYFSLSASSTPIRESDRKALWYDHADLINKYLDPLMLKKMHKESGAWEFKEPVDLSEYKVKWSEMKKDHEVARLLKLAILHREYMNHGYEKDLERAENLLFFIQNKASL